MKALLIIDVQNDFLPGGALSVLKGDEIIPVINRLIENPEYKLVVASKDWHPEDSHTFAKTHGKNQGDEILIRAYRQTLWPVHCVQGTRGSDFPDGLKSDLFDHIVYKGIDPKKEGYSPFFNVYGEVETELHELLQTRGIREIDIVGLVIEMCVKATALDAKKLGYDVNVIMEGCRGAENRPGDVAKAVDKMVASGVRVV